jgi:hypothetical protein
VNGFAAALGRHATPALISETRDFDGIPINLQVLHGSNQVGVNYSEKLMKLLSKPLIVIFP